MTKKEIQSQIDELHTRITELHQELKKCPEVEPSSWVPISGELIRVGSVDKREFIGVNAVGKYICWDENKVNTISWNKDYCSELQQSKHISVKPFTCKGKWYTEGKATAYKGKGDSTARRKNFNYWQSKEIAEKAYALQLRHRKMLSFVSQHQELGEGVDYIYQHSDGEWEIGNTGVNYPDTVMMTKETADKMLEAIENGSLDLS